jgi:hypothetical protein
LEAVKQSSSILRGSLRFAWSVDADFLAEVALNCTLAPISFLDCDSRDSHSPTLRFAG